MIKKYPEYKHLDFAQVGEEILKYWKKHQIFEKSIQSREGQASFTFYEGPPSANGTPGIHHVMGRALKDLFCRYKTLKGFQVERKGGWDTHGLPVEIQVEKQLGITKEDIGTRISVEEYNRKCREAVMKYKDQWDDLTEKVGFWLDLDNPYITFEPKYIESLWSLLKKLFDKDLLYKGYTIQPFSPAAGTGLSSHELNQPGTYKDVKDLSTVAQFKIKETDFDYFLAWTTTPWTLPANNALAIGKNIKYAKVHTYNQYTHASINVILAHDVISKYFDPKARDIAMEDYQPGDKLIPYKVLESYPGKELVGLEYEQLLPYVPLPHPAFTVVTADFVSIEEGTGIVHISKTFGADDFRVSVKHNIPGVFVKDAEGNDVPIVDRKGRFVKEITDFAGMYVKNYNEQDETDPGYESTDLKIVMKLKEENKAFKIERYVHSYPHCWRTDKPILYYPLESWFIKTTACKDQLVALNDTINWKPKSTGTGRFGNWLENLVDWNLSRSRFWGTPLPIWVTEDKKEVKCIGSIEELENEISKSIEAGFLESSPFEGQPELDLHRPYVDQVILTSDSGQRMFREPDLIDVWFDSGAMPSAQWHFPFENHTSFEKHFPADFIAEGVDQTRGWFFTLHAIGVMLFNSVAFKNVVANGLVLDQEGNKMSKRLGNAVDPFATIKKYGPDPTRWYLMANANPWDNLKFDESGILEVQRRFFATLQNTYSFFALYANLDGFDYSEADIPLAQRAESDRWILSRLNTLIYSVEGDYDDYEPTKVARAIQDFVINDLSNWYVRLNRKRFWRTTDNSGTGDRRDKLSAYQTLYTCLLGVCQVASPIAPFYMEKIFVDLNNATSKEPVESVHLSSFPEADSQIIETELEEKMKMAQNISSLVHSLRRKHKIKVRQPLSKILIPILNARDQTHIEEMTDLILAEVNIKEIQFIDDTSGILIKRIKPNFRKLGKEYGPRMKEISRTINSLSQEDIRSFESQETLSISTQSGLLSLSLDDVEITSEDIPGWSVASENGLTVALDININPELRKEGLARDLVNRVQNMRKAMGLEVQDRITIAILKSDDFVNSALEEHRQYICRETQAVNLVLWDDLPDGSPLQMDNLNLVVRIRKS